VVLEAERVDMEREKTQKRVGRVGGDNERRDDEETRMGELGISARAERRCRKCGGGMKK
jgi:hypothetical protein